MEIMKHVVIKESQDIQIKEVTLLSREEYNANIDLIPPANGWWWLRSPGSRQYYAAFVDICGSLNYYSYVSDDRGGVRPALRICNPYSSLVPGDKFDLAGHVWTVISDELALCDESIGETSFRFDTNASDANIYEKSDIRIWLENWAKEKGLI